MTLKVFSLTTGADTGGWAGRMNDAFNQHPQGLAPGSQGLAPQAPVSYHSMCNSDNYIEYPYDLPYSLPLLCQLYDRADVIHLHNTLHGHHFYDNGQGKPTVLIHHGILFRGSPRVVAQEARDIGAVQICSTIDLESKELGVTWVPVPYELDGPISSLVNRGIPESFQGLRAAYYPHKEEGKVIRIGHAPTNRAIKSTDAFLASTFALAERGLPVEAVLIEGKTHYETLRVKATCDLFMDQLHLGYGCNAVEAWAMGIPVIAATDDPVVRKRMLDRWGVLPFVEATEATLEATIKELVLSKDLRDDYGALGYAHARMWHDATVVAPILTDIYQSAPMTKPGGAMKRGKPANPMDQLALLRFKRAQEKGMGA